MREKSHGHEGQHEHEYRQFCRALPVAPSRAHIRPRQHNSRHDHQQEYSQQNSVLYFVPGRLRIAAHPVRRVPTGDQTEIHRLAAIGRRFHPQRQFRLSRPRPDPRFARIARNQPGPLRRRRLKLFRIQTRRCKKRRPIRRAPRARRRIQLRRYPQKFHQPSVRRKKFLHHPGQPHRGLLRKRSGRPAEIRVLHVLRTLAIPERYRRRKSRLQSFPAILALVLILYVVHEPVIPPESVRRIHARRITQRLRQFARLFRQHFRRHRHRHQIHHEYAIGQHRHRGESY